MCVFVCVCVYVCDVLSVFSVCVLVAVLVYLRLLTVGQDHNATYAIPYTIIAHHCPLLPTTAHYCPRQANKKISSLRTELVPFLVNRQFQSEEYLRSVMPALKARTGKYVRSHQIVKGIHGIHFVVSYPYLLILTF